VFGVQPAKPPRLVAKEGNEEGTTEKNTFRRVHDLALRRINKLSNVSEKKE